MRTFLKALFILVIAALLAGTVQASMDRGVLTALKELWPDPWFRATLYDAYFAFLTFYVWVAYKETCWINRIIWFILIMLLGNFAIASYVLIQLFKLKPNDSFDNLLLRSSQKRSA